MKSTTLVDLKKITGTSLYTGLYYRMSAKAFEKKNWITYQGASNYLEVELTTGKLPRYEPGNSYQFDNQWVFIESEVENAYTIINRGKPYGLLSITDDGVGSGVKCAIIDDPLKLGKLRKGGSSRKDVLWFIKATSDGYYNLENYARQKVRGGGFLQTSNTKVPSQGNNVYIQSAYNDENDSKFRLSPVIRLDAKVSNFEFKENFDQLFATARATASRITAKNPTKSTHNYNLARAKKTKSTVAIRFKKSLEMMYSVSWSSEIKIITAGSSFSVTGGIAKEETKTFASERLTEVKIGVDVPAHTSIVSNVNLVWLDKTKLTFTAVMKATAKGDRLSSINHPQRVSVGPVNAEIIEEYMKANAGDDTVTVVKIDDYTVSANIDGELTSDLGIKLEIYNRAI